jgi:CheY-like chemotaxis protein
MSQRIMVVDNDEATQELFEILLADEGWEVFSYDYTHANLEVTQQLMPDLIILDLNMVQAGAGWSFLQLLKMEDATAVIPVVICTTAVILSLEIEGYLAARHISVVRKPFDIDAFILIIRKNLTPELVLPILVVEDNEELSDTVTTILQLWGYLVATASNGRLALDAVTQSRHALILLDITMPVMNGLEFLAAYAQQPEPHSPVIIFSAQSDLVSKDLPNFVMDVLPKPFELSQLVTIVSKYAEPVWGEVGP